MTDYNGPVICEAKYNERRMLLRDLKNKVIDRHVDIINHQERMMDADLEVEERVLNELLTSSNDMIIIPNITIEETVKYSLIKFLILTTKGIIIIHVRKLYQDIDVAGDGSFIHVSRNRDGVVYRKDNYGNPIIKNQHRIEVLDKIIKECDLKEDYPIYSLVVIANDISVNASSTTEDIRRQIVSVYDLNNTINNLLSKSTVELSKDYLIAIKDYILSKDIPNENNYIIDLNLKLKVDGVFRTIECDDTLYEALKQYRQKKAEELNYRPYIIFNNDTLADLCLRSPTTKDELLRIKNFGPSKFDKYGNDILDIIKNN